jgi:hypothetical protein
MSIKGGAPRQQPESGLKGIGPRQELRNVGGISKYVIFMIGAGCRPEAPVAERGPVGFSEGGNRRDWFPGVRRPRAASCAEWNHINGDAIGNLLQLEN